jgi:hypothetical protein
VTRQEEARQLLARLSELARDETLSEEDATEMVAGLVGALERMRENPAWQRVMAKAGPPLFSAVSTYLRRVAGEHRSRSIARAPPER